MGQDLELEFEKYCMVDGSPKTVLPSPRHPKLDKRKVRAKPKCGNEVLTRNADFTEISFHRYRSASCRAVPSRLECDNEVKRRGSVYQSSNERVLPPRLNVNNEVLKRGSVYQSSNERALPPRLTVDNEVLKRGSVYQSSNERTKMEKFRETDGRQKFECSKSSGTALTIEIVGFLCSSDEDSSLVEQSSRSSVMLNETLQKDSLHPTSEREHRQSTETPKLRCDRAVALHKSLSASLAIPHSSTKLANDSSTVASPKTLFNPIRKMLDPFNKSKFQKSPLRPAIGPDEATSTESLSMKLQKSLLNDFPNTIQDDECDPQLVKEESCILPMPCSPAHLSGVLKLENKHGVPYFEFSVRNPADVLVAKTWKVGDAFNWVYTFHAAQNRRKSNVSGWGLRHSKKESTMVGQMQVSCYLCTELMNAGAFDSSMVTEFVLYDTARLRNPVAKTSDILNESSLGEPCEPNGVADQTKVKSQPKEAYDSVCNDASMTCPWPVTDLHPEHEIAGIVIQFPFEKRESLKLKRGDMKNDGLLDFCSVQQKKKPVSGCLNPAKVHVVTPSGNHGVPTVEGSGPSPLLDRWRLGGGCDCGGWDMGCPLHVFDNPNILKYEEDHPLTENRQPMELFVQGNKENTPALIMKLTKEGQYAVDFHAQLTSLQAFSICVAILHSTEASIAIGRERDRQSLQCDSLRVFIEDEVKHLIEVVAEEEKRKPLGETPPSFILNPPFSPMSRA